MSDKYNGWTNYETWCAKLWIDQEGYDYWFESAQESDSATDLADAMKDNYMYTMPELTGMWSDLMQSSFDAINWCEIATAFIDDANEEV